MWNKFIISALVVIFSSLQCYGIEAYFDLKKFKLPSNACYVETHVSFAADGVGYKRTENGQLLAEVETTIIISQGSEVVDFKKNIISSPLVTDSTLADFFDIQKFLLPPGEYTVELKLNDLNAPINPTAELKQTFILDFSELLIEYSDLILVASAEKAFSAGPLTKSGMDIVPFISDYYSSRMNNLQFYAEIYNTATFLDEDMFLLNTFISERFSTDPVEGLVKMSRKEAADVIPVLQSFDISKVPTGLYTLHVEIRNKKNEILTTKTLDFQRNNYQDEATAESVQNIDVATTFTALFDRKDSLIEYMNSCHPIATNLERSTIENQMQYADLPTLQKYFFYFWSRRNEQNPEDAWLVYKEKVDYVDDEYGTRVKEGYETDRGRVYLQYGAPNTIVLRHNPVNVSPYEIWHYYQIGEFNNKRFLFYSREAVTVDFVLLHSDMLGEVQNNDWPVVMRSKNVEVRSSDSSRNQQNRQNAFAGDELEDLFYNPR